MILYRIIKSRYAEDLSAYSASRYGGRWSSEGKHALYLASSHALAALEVLLHLPPLMIPDDYCLTAIEIPDDRIITNISIDDLPSSWKEVSFPQELQTIGDKFLKKQAHLLMRVPSTIIPNEFNYLLNTRHPDISKVKIISKEPFSFEEKVSPQALQ